MANLVTPPSSLTVDTTLEQLLKNYPQVAPALERYGFTGNSKQGGGDKSQTLRKFSQANSCDPRSLMDDIRKAIAVSAHHHTASKLAAGQKTSLADTIYKPFFLGAIFITLTAGASWGVWLLWKIGIDGAFAGASIDQINAHGHAQIFGWVGLFILGVCLQIVPRMLRVKLPAGRLTFVCFVALFAAIIVRSAGIALGGGPAGGEGLEVVPAYVALAAGAIECLAIIILVAILTAAFVKSEAHFEPFIAFIFAGLGWFIIQAIYSQWHIFVLMTAPNEQQMYWQLSTYQGPLRDLQFHGLALFMILGVSLRMLPAMFGLPRIARARSWAALCVLIVSVLGEAVLFIAYRQSENIVVAALLLLCWFGILVGVLLVALPWKLWRPLVTHNRSAKFVRIAYGWLIISLLMLIFMPLYLGASGMNFSHAYYGAMRHAFAVGFISIMIMGMAARFVPNLTGWSRFEGELTRLNIAFILINIGCLWRVVAQVLTDFYPWAYQTIGISGTLELIALVLWAGHLVKLMMIKPPLPSRK